MIKDCHLCKAQLQPELFFTANLGELPGFSELWRNCCNLDFSEREHAPHSGPFAVVGSVAWGEC